MSARLALRSGPLELELAPALGGAVTAFRIDGPEPAPLFREVPATIARSVDAAAFALVPFSNRIRGGRFKFRDREVRLAPNMDGDPSPLHGQGWTSAWTVTEAGDASAELGLSHPAGEWPWEYQARQSLSLDADGLDWEIAVRNLSDQPMPAGLGLHPYLPCNAETVLDAAVERVWTVDDLVLPVRREPAEGRYDLNLRRICGAGLDNGYEGWGGQAVVRWPDRGLGLRMRAAERYFQVYAPPQGGLIAIEPVSHANDALARPELEWGLLGVRILAPGDEASLSARFEVLWD
jgi:aldose 1-epimerase